MFQKLLATIRNYSTVAIMSRQSCGSIESTLDMVNATSHQIMDPLLFSNQHVSNLHVSSCAGESGKEKEEGGDGKSV